MDFRIFAQSRDKDLLRMANPDGFFRRSMVTFLEGVPVCMPRLQMKLDADDSRVLRLETT